jgi:predicted ArsR family transcriptional regulator
MFHKLKKKLGRAPTLREISLEMGFTENGAQRHLAALVERGLLTPPEEQRVRIQDVTPAGLKWV